MVPSVRDQAAVSIENDGGPAPDPALPATGRDPYSSPHMVDENPRCRYCHAKLAVFVGRPWRFRCRKCGAVTQSPDAENFRPSPALSGPTKGRAIEGAQAS